MSDETPGWAHPSGEPERRPEDEAVQPTRPIEPVSPAAEDGDGVPPVEPAAPAPADPDEPRSDRRRGILIPVVVAAVVAALIGGGVGATTVALVRPGGGSTTALGAGAGSNASNVVINDPQNATAITAVAAKASPSVVTVNVAAASGNEAGTGSGIVLNTGGDVLTNNHVVTLDGATSDDTITATTSSGRLYKAKVVGTDPINDLAVIKLADASGLTPATFADSSKLNVGDTAIAIGAPLGLSGTVTNGIVSALNRSIQVESSAVPDDGDSSGDDGGSGQGGPFTFNFGDGQTQQATSTISLSVIQTDAAINPGNSGGALLNGDGQVIGVNVAIASAGSSSSSSSGQSGSIGVGFAIPANIAQRVAGDLMAGKAVTHGLLGANVGDATSGTVVGAQIAKVAAGGAAAKAGLKAGDVVTKFGGVTIQSASDLTAQVRALAGGASTSLTYVRDGSATTVDVTLGTYRAAS